MAIKLVLLGAAGALGALSRYGLGLFVERHATGVFPWPTFVVNMAGCLLFGLFYGLAEERMAWQGDVRLIVLTGFMGSFTTFSTFAFQTDALIRDAQWTLVAANILGHNLLGIVFLALGLSVGKAI